MRKLLPVALNWGVTTIRMVGNDKPEIMHVYAEAREGKFPSPRVYSAGQGFNLSGPISRRADPEADDTRRGAGRACRRTKP